MKKATIWALDECGYETKIDEFNIPFADGELTDIEYAAMCQLYKSRCWIAPEYMKTWIETNYKTKEDIEEEEKADNDFFEECLKEADGDEDLAYEIYADYKYSERYIF